MILKIEFVERLGQYQIPKVALFDNEQISEKEAMAYIKEGVTEVGTKFLVLSSNAYALLEKATKK